MFNYNDSIFRVTDIWYILKILFFLYFERGFGLKVSSERSGGYTKVKADRIVFLNEEWLDYEYRTRRVCYQHKQNGKTITEYRTPYRKETDLVFAVYQDKKHQIQTSYTTVWVIHLQRH